MAGTCEDLSTASVERAGRAGVFVHVDDADGAVLVPAQGEVGDVDAVTAEDRPDLADDARLIVVAR